MKKIKNSIVSVKQKKSSSSPIKNWILESARICYDTLGFDKTTTNKIAIKAGVSIGSLYQYFPNKEAIFCKLTDKFIHDNEYFLLELISTQAHQPLSLLVENVVSLAIDHFVERKIFLKLVLTKMFEIGFSELVFNQRKQLASKILIVLQNYYPGHFKSLNNKELELAYGFNAQMGALTVFLTSEFNEEHFKTLKKNQINYFKTILEVD